MAVPKEKFGIMANPSTRMTITLAAINISPKLLVKDCTIIIAMEKIACVTPEGSPRRIVSMVCLFVGAKSFPLSSKMSFICSSLQRHNREEIPCAIAVANATPATPMSKDATNKTSSMILSTVETSKYKRADTESPRPRRIPLRIL